MRTMLLSVIVFFLAKPSALLAQPERSKTSSYVKVRVRTERPDPKGEQKVEIILDIDKDCYLIGADAAMDLEPSRLRIEILANGKPTKAKFSYPSGQRERDMGLGGYSIYHGQVVISGIFQRTPETDPLELVIRMQGHRPTH